MRAYVKERLAQIRAEAAAEQQAPKSDDARKAKAERKRAYSRAYYAVPANRERMKAASRASARRLARERGLLKYGIDSAEYADMEVRQGGVCAICKEACSSGKALAVDHCHETGKVRGLLCTRCNMGIGMFQDSPERLQAATTYLHTTKTPTGSI